MALLSTQPFKALYTLYALALEAVRIPVYMLIFLVPGLRPCRQWSHGQAVRIKLLRASVYHSAIVEVQMPLSLEPGREGDRFVVMPPADTKLYKGPLADGHTRPVDVGGTWYPARYPSNASASNGDPAEAAGTVVLHFHGGAFVLGDGREKDCGHLARGLLENAGVSFVFCPQYRLAGPPTSARFPAPLQDAITAYAYLLHTLQIPASRIVVSGDSAGGNIANALLRYVAEYGGETALPAPACAFLWSPWINPNGAVDKANLLRNPNYPTDFLSKDFGAWGCRLYASHCDINDPYISGGATPFRSETPIWVQTCGRELLFHDNVEYAESMKKVEGNVTGFEIVEHAPHDVALLGHFIGFSREYAEVARKAGQFLSDVTGQ